MGYTLFAHVRLTPADRALVDAAIEGRGLDVGNHDDCKRIGALFHARAPGHWTYRREAFRDPCSDEDSSSSDADPRSDELYAWIQCTHVVADPRLRDADFRNDLCGSVALKFNCMALSSPTSGDDLAAALETYFPGDPELTHFAEWLRATAACDCRYELSSCDCRYELSSCDCRYELSY